MLKLVSVQEVEEIASEGGSTRGISDSVQQTLDEILAMEPGTVAWMLPDGAELQRTLSQRFGNAVRFEGAFSRFFRQRGKARVNGRVVKGVKVYRATDEECAQYANEGAPKGWERIEPKDTNEG